MVAMPGSGSRFRCGMSVRRSPRARQTPSTILIRVRSAAVLVIVLAHGPGLAGAEIVSCCALSDEAVSAINGESPMQEHSRRHGKTLTTTEVNMGAIRAGLALIVVAGCQSWRERPVTAPDPSAVARTLRLTTNQGARRLTLEGATVRSDSVVGVLVEASDRRGNDWTADAATVQGQRVAVALADISSLEERTSKNGGVLLLVIAVAALVLFFGSQLRRSLE
jgi:hypothetical protein